MPPRLSFDANRTCARSSISGLFFLSVSEKFSASNSSFRPIGAPLPFWRPTTRSCSSSVVRSHCSIRIRMRRATR